MATTESKLTGKSVENAEKASSEKSAEMRAENTANRTVEKSVDMNGESRTGKPAYRLQLPMYERPLDSLLDLIKQQKMSIHDTRISEITAQYLHYLHMLEELDVDVSADFLYMPA